MTSRPQRSLSVGAVPHVKPLLRSRAESASGGVLEVRCACQYFQSDSLLPERINPVGGSRPISPDGLSRAAIYISHDAKLDKLLQQAEEIDEPRGSILGIVTTTDYYADTGSLSRPTSNAEFEPLSGLRQIELEYPQASKMPGATSAKTQEFSSQRSLDKLKNSTLLQRYNKRASSQDLQGSNVDFRQGPLMVPASQPPQPIVKNVYSSEETSDIEPMSYGREYYTQESNADAPRSRESRYMTSSSDEGRAGQLRRNSNFEQSTARSAESADVTQNFIGSNEQVAIQDQSVQPRPEFSSQQSLNRMRTSSLLQKYNKRSNSQDQAKNMVVEEAPRNFIGSDKILVNQDPQVAKPVPVKPEFSSQQSLNRMRTSSLLQKYNKRSNSQDQAHNVVNEEVSQNVIGSNKNLANQDPQSSQPVPVGPEFSSQQSLNRMRTSSLLQKYNKRSSSQDQPNNLASEEVTLSKTMKIDLSDQQRQASGDLMKNSTLLQRYNKRSSSQDQPRSSTFGDENISANNQSTIDDQPSISINLDRMKRSSLLQRYNKRATSQDPQEKIPIENLEQPAATKVFSSQQNLDRMRNSSLLQKYNKRAQSQDRTATKPVLDEMRKSVKNAPPFGSYDVFDYRMSPVLFDANGKLQDSLNSRDHEYEPIGEPVDQSSTKVADNSRMEKLNVDPSTDADKVSIQDIQDEMEARFNSPTPTTASGTDADIHTSQVNSSALENLPLKKESRQKRMMLSAQERSRKLSSKFKTQAGKLKNRMSNMKKPKRSSQVMQEGAEVEDATPTGTEGSQATPVGTEGGSQTTPESNLPSEEMETEEPAKEKRRFRTPERFRNMHMPKINRPQFKRPAMTMPKMPPIPKMPPMPQMPKFKKPNFSRPEMPNFHVQEKFNSLRLKRSKSLKEPSAAVSVETATESYTTESTPPKKKFDITFGTYPRILSKLKRQKTESSVPRLRQDTPPPLEFTTLPTAGTQRTGKIVSRYPEEETASDTKYTDESAPEQQFGSVPDITTRESSIERRMKLHFQQKAADEDAAAGFLLTDEQKQMEEFDKENREIHQISKAKEQDFKQRKPIERQESDLTSEEEKQFWRSPLGQKIKQSYTDNGDESFELDMNDNQLLVQGNGLGGTSTPHTNQETQSSGSSAAKRMKDVLDEIEQNEMYLREGGNDSVEYAHSAIREGLENPVNTLARMGRFDSSYDEDYSAASDKINYPPVKPGRSKKPMKFNISADSEDMMVPNIDDDAIDRNNYDDDYFKTFPPSKPLRKQPLVPQYSDEAEPEPYAQDYPTYYENERMKGIEQPNIVLNSNNYDENFDLSLHDSELMMDDVNFAVPPTPPRRRKKRFRDFSTSLERGGENDGIGRFTERSVSNTILPNMEQQQNLLIYRTQHEYNVPLAQEEHFVTPVPTPRRSRSQSQMSRMTDDDRTSRGADSNILDAQLEAMADSKFIVDMQETNGYAVIRKEPPPRPPAPLRRKRSTKSLGERQFFTMPSRGKQTDLDEQPMRPTRNYSTLLPTRPPRRKSATSLLDIEPAPSEADGSQYEEINDGGESKSHSKLQSGEILNKMKDRPLPPPPRPPRERKQPKNRFDDDDDRDGGGERIRIADSASESDVLSQYVEEIDKETQTDPLPDDFQCEEFEITPDMRTITPTQAKATFSAYNDSIPLQDNQSIASNDDEALSRGIAKFREASQRSHSERSRGSASKPSSRPTTPALITLERKISTSTTPDNVDQMAISATLLVQPLELTDGRDEDEIMEALIREQEEEERLKLQLELEQELEKEKQRALEEQETQLRELDELEKRNQRKQEEAEREKQRQLEEEERQKILQELQEAREADERQRFEAEMRAIREERKREEERKQIEEARKQLELERQQLEQDSLRREQEIQHMLEEVKKQAELERLQAEANAAATEKLENREEIIRSNLLSEHKPKTDSFDKSLVEELDLQVVDSEQPIAPPRRKISGGDEQPIDRPAHSLELTSQQQVEVLEKHRLHLSSLEIDRLNVTALQAGKIVASELETGSINTQTIHSESGNLRTVDDLPAGLIEEIVGRVIEQHHQEQQKLQKDTQAETNTSNRDENPDSAPPRPPQPYFHPDYLPYSMPPQSFYQLRNYSDEEPGAHQPPTRTSPPSHRRKRHQRKRDSTSEDEYQKEHEKSKRSSHQNTHSPEPPTALELGGQLVQRAVINLGDFGQQLMAALRASSKDENRRDLHVALIILIVIFAGLIMLGFTTNKAVHHHHWDYFNPPEGKP